MWSWLSPIEWQRKAWLIHISGKNFLTESELCDLALSPTEDTLPFVSPGPILPRSQTLHKCPTEPPLCTCRANVPTWLQSQLLFATTNFYFGSALPQKTGLCPTEFPPFPTIMPWCSQLYWTMTSFSSLPTFSCEMHCHRKLRLLFVARIASYCLKVSDSLSVTATSLFLPFHTLAFFLIFCNQLSLKFSTFDYF